MVRSAAVRYCPTILMLMLMALLLFSQAGYSQSESDDRLQITQLNSLVSSLNEKLVARDAVRTAMSTSSAEEVVDLRQALEEINKDLRDTRQAIEQIAVGSVDLSEFVEDDTELNWRTELTQITLPLIQNLKRLTEKPRKVEAARMRIEQASEQRRNARLAEANVASLMGRVQEPQTLAALDNIRMEWADNVEEYDREINLATVQLSNLQRSDTPVWVAVTDALVSFFKGRGLTIFLAVVVAFVVFRLAKLIASRITRRQKGEDKEQFRTRERIIDYALQAVRALLILISVLVVFYLRGDILLMGIAFVILAGLILGLRHTLPKFIEELQLLLNLGSVRENERVVYQGLPWKVSQLNMYSVLTNPEITGVLRVPMHDIRNLSSRPVGKEPWFPASRGDYVLFDDDRLLQLIKLTPEHVLFESLAGTRTMMPTADVFSMVFENLSRSPFFFVSTVFGIGYSHQADSVTGIPDRLRSALEAALASNADLAVHVESVSAELQEASASSLDFWLGVKMKSEAATSYFKIKRIMQQVCVQTCTDEGWDIPFPHLTLHNA